MSSTSETGFTEVAVQIPFHDVDAMHVVWHGHYYKYFELARTEFFRQRSCDIHRCLELGYVLPIVDSRCRYIHPLTYGMHVRVRATLIESEHRIKLNYILLPEGAQKPAARGTTVQVAVARDTQTLCLVIPDSIAHLVRGDSC